MTCLTQPRRSFQTTIPFDDSEAARFHVRGHSESHPLDLRAVFENERGDIDECMIMVLHEAVLSGIGDQWIPINPGSFIDFFGGEIETCDGDVFPAAQRDFEANVNSTELPPRLREEGIEQPTDVARKTAIAVGNMLFESLREFPSRVGASVEGGLLLFYKHSFFSRSLAVEVYNDGAIASVVNERHEILVCEEIVDMNFQAVLRAFNG